MRDEGEDAHEAGKRESDRHARQHRSVSELQPIALQKEDDLESLAIERRESEQREAQPESAADALCISACLVRLCIEIQPRPVHLVEKPVHHHEQHDDGEQPGRGLDVERGDVLREAVDDGDSEAPGDEGGNEREQRAEGDGTLKAARAPTMLAVTAASTMMHSSPSRKTRTEMSRTRAPKSPCVVGSGSPPVRRICSTRIAATVAAARVTRKAETDDRPMKRRNRDSTWVLFRRDEAHRRAGADNSLISDWIGRQSESLSQAAGRLW